MIAAAVDIHTTERLRVEPHSKEIDPPDPLNPPHPVEPSS
jgi:hypothetical protein